MNLNGSQTMHCTMPDKFFGLVLSFVFAFLLSLIVPSFFSKVEVSFLIPVLVMSFYFVSLNSAAWLALGIGLLLDILNLLPRLGFLGSAYLVTALILYPWRLYFFKDAFSTLPIMTYLFSVFSSLIQALIALLFDLPSFSFSVSWLVSDCFIMPLIDAAGALIFFSLPHFLYSNYYRIKKTRRA